MCGIAGIYGSFQPADRLDAMQAMAKHLAHRGPDGTGKFEADEVALLHTRLSIIDLSENGNQPLFNEDKTLTLICNGEIYNYQQLRSDLLQRGHTFGSHSDCEVILHLYEEHKNEPKQMLNMLTGMFAFALWDANAKRLLIARDRVGIKPLYFSHSNGKLIFASEVKPIANSGLMEATEDVTSLYEYFLLGSIPGPNTLYKEIKSLEPGHYLTLDNGKLTESEYWDIPRGLRNWNSEEEALGETESLLSQVIKDHLVADVPVGTFLSAGVDSSLLTAIAASHHPGIHSFTASFPGEPEDEGAMAAATAAKLKTSHNSYELSDNFFADFSSQFRDLDQPFAISSGLSLGRISRIAQQKVKVVLSGDGGDELFGGYSRHEFPKQPGFLDYIPGPLQNVVLKAGAQLTGKKSLDTLRQNLQVSDGQKFLDRIRVTDEQTAMSFLAPHMHKEVDKNRFLNRLNRLFDKRKGEDPLNRVLYVDMKTTLVDEMLTKCDRMTMINAIEGRVPLLDHRLVELAFSMPGHYKRSNGTGKLILRRLLAKHLGNELAFRVKTGFNSPLKQWLASDEKTISFVKSEIGEATSLDFLDRNVVERYAQQPHNFASGQVFSLVCLNHFFQGESINSYR
jgi:asparagine synthase (glutamine-hydrolysing)